MADIYKLIDEYKELLDTKDRLKDEKIGRAHV